MYIRYNSELAQQLLQLNVRSSKEHQALYRTCIDVITNTMGEDNKFDINAQTISIHPSQWVNLIFRARRLGMSELLELIIKAEWEPEYEDYMQSQHTALIQKADKSSKDKQTLIEKFRADMQALYHRALTTELHIPPFGVDDLVTLREKIIYALRFKQFDKFKQLLDQADLNTLLDPRDEKFQIHTIMQEVLQSTDDDFKIALTDHIIFVLSEYLTDKSANQSWFMKTLNQITHIDETKNNLQLKRLYYAAVRYGNFPLISSITAQHSHSERLQSAVSLDELLEVVCDHEYCKITPDARLKIAGLLIEHGANPYGKFPARISKQDNQYRFPVYLAIQAGNRDLMRVLLGAIAQQSKFKDVAIQAAYDQIVADESFSTLSNLGKYERVMRTYLRSLKSHGHRHVTEDVRYFNSVLRHALYHEFRPEAAMLLATKRYYNTDNELLKAWFLKGEYRKSVDLLLSNDYQFTQLQLCEYFDLAEPMSSAHTERFQECIQHTRSVSYGNILDIYREIQPDTEDNTRWNLLLDKAAELNLTLRATSHSATSFTFGQARPGLEDDVILQDDLKNLDVLVEKLFFVNDPENLRRVLEKNIIDIDTRDQNGKTLLHLAAEKHDLPMVMLLMEYTNNLLLQDRKGKNPLQYLFDFGRAESGNLKDMLQHAYPFQDFAEIVQYFENKTRKSSADILGNKPASVALNEEPGIAYDAYRYGNQAFTELLVDCGASDVAIQAELRERETRMMCKQAELYLIKDAYYREYKQGFFKNPKSAMRQKFQSALTELDLLRECKQHAIKHEKSRTAKLFKSNKFDDFKVSAITPEQLEFYRFRADYNELRARKHLPNPFNSFHRKLNKGKLNSMDEVLQVKQDKIARSILSHQA